MRKIIISSQETKKICRLYLKNNSIGIIATMMGYTRSKIYRVLKENNINTKLDTNKYRESYKTNTLNDNFFKKINTFDKAYILGFLYADGTLYNSRPQVRLGITDIDMLHKIKKIIGYTGNLINTTKVKSHHKEKKVLILCNKIIYADLIKLGMYTNKTFNCKFPSFLGDKYIPHFIRGYFDGDGWVSTHKKTTMTGEVGIMGTTEFCDGLLEYLKTKNIHGTIRFDKRCDPRVVSLMIRRKESFKFFYKLIYKNSSKLRLERKYVKFLAYNYIK